MLNLNSETVCLLIEKAREFHAKEEVVIPEEPDSPAEDWARQTLADHSSDLTYQEVKSLIDDLEPDQQLELVALMWLGRGDYELSDWQSILKDAEDSHSEYIAEYLLAKPLLASYLDEALNQMGISCQQEIEFDNFGMRL
ncbi:DUF3775 domain-containing protein [Marinobacterium arenosum]|uniref:DUF3775 domain-containing protein n=1 Tax=Marinobacterium arenosum TaxID=2862496 RepID=UPI001C97EA22|nr:DUF3775 domain-containing protein [Marinobacterium arenosum]MBY4674981.1 DUF3775 domain-containing protein [Marinobacterium arenosum]